MTMKTLNPWNGEFEDGEIERPAYRTPLSYVIQHGETGYVWMTFSHLKMTPIAQGVAESLDEARTAVKDSKTGHKVEVVS